MKKKSGTTQQKETKQTIVIDEKSIEKLNKPFNFMEWKPFGKNNHASMMNALKEKLKPANTFLINMEMRNGMHATFMISTNKTSFKYEEGNYVIDSSQKYFNINSKCWMLDYHQDITIPIKREVPVNDMMKAIKASGFVECETSINPSTMQSFIDSKVAEGVMRSGGQVDKVFSTIKMLLLLTVIGSMGSMLILIFKSGILGAVGI